MKKVSYVAVFFLKRSQTIRIGSLGKISLWRGYYLYVGSYPKKSVTKRILRHAAKKKKLFWHIDYFSHLGAVEFKGYYLFDLAECSLAALLLRRYQYIKGFGSSDCNCPSHFFFSGDMPKGKEEIVS